MTLPLGEDFARADPHAVALLAASDVPTWERLINDASSVAPSEACPPTLLRALLAIDGPEGWRRRCDVAYGGRAPWDGGGGAAGHYVLRPWLARGIVQHLPATDLPSLDLRYRALLDDASADATTLARALVAAVERAGASEASQSLLGNALLLLAHRLREDGDHEGTIAAAQRAEDLFTRTGDAPSRVRAVRMRGAALLRCRRLDEALAVLSAVHEAPPVSAPPIEPRAPTATSDDAFFVCASRAERDTQSASWFDALARLGARAAKVVPVAGTPRIYDAVQNDDGSRTWKWAVLDAFNPVYDATASAEGVTYGCEIQGPFCGYDREGSQTWDELLTVGPPANVRMPTLVEAEIRAFGLARKARN